MDVFLVLFGVWVLVAIMLGYGSHIDGKDFWAVFLVSFFLSPIIGLIVYFFLKKKNTTCQYCGSELLPTDIFCQACGKDKKGITKQEYSSRSILK